MSPDNNIKPEDFKKRDLLDKIESKNYRVRAKAVKALGKTGNPEYRLKLKDLLFSEKNPEVIAAIIIAMGKLGDHEQLNNIISYLDSDNLLLKTAALKSLTLLGPKNLFQIISPCLKDKDNTIISLTVKILWRFFPKKLLNEIRMLLENDKKEFRKCAVWALSELQFSVAAPLLKKAQADDNISIRLTAGDILKQLEDNFEKEQSKEEFLNKKPFSEMTRPARDRNIIVNNGSDPFVSDPFVSDQPKEDLPASTQTAADQPANPKPIADKNISDEPISEKHISEESASDESVSDESASNEPVSDESASNEPVSAKTAAVLNISDENKIKDKQDQSPVNNESLDFKDPTKLICFKELTELLSQSKPDVIIKTVKIFESAGEKSVIPKLLDLLEKNQNEHVTATVIKAIGYLGNEDNIEYIASFLKNSSPRIVSNALEGLSYINSEKCLNLAIPFLENPNSRIRQNALVLVSFYKEDMIFNEIESLAFSSSDTEQQIAVRTLEKIGTQRALNLLNTIYLDSENEIHKMCGQAVNSVKNAHTILRRLKSDEEPKKRYSDNSARKINHLSFSLTETKEENKKLSEENLALKDRIKFIESNFKKERQALEKELEALNKKAMQAKKPNSEHSPENNDNACEVLKETEKIQKNSNKQNRKKHKSINHKKTIFIILMLIFFIMLFKISLTLIQRSRNFLGSTYNHARVYVSGLLSANKNKEPVKSVIKTSRSSSASRGSADSAITNNAQNTSTKSSDQNINKNTDKISNKTNNETNNETNDKTNDTEQSGTLDEQKKYKTMLSKEVKQGILKIDGLIKKCTDIDDNSKLQLLEQGLDSLRDNFYMGELYIFETCLKEKNTDKAIKELEKVKSMICRGYILWDFQTGEWISPREDY